MTADRVMLLTPPGAAAIAVVRLSGARTAEFLASHFSRPLAPGRPIHGSLSDGDRILDDPVLVLHDSGADICLHGGPWVVRQVLELAGRCGFEPVSIKADLPLPPQALDGGDEQQRLIQANLPLARTELALRWLMARPPRNDLSPGSPLWWLLHPPRLAIVGAANVGKSTLANCLFAQERSITADAPGTTRDWVGEIADLDGLAVFLIDTPGWRQADDPLEQAALAGGGEQIRRADLIVLVVDAASSLAEQAEWVGRYPRALVVRNRCDRAATFSSIDGVRPHLHTVAITGQGVDGLRQAIRRRFIAAWRRV
jgi:tRNA modification GTPase